MWVADLIEVIVGYFREAARERSKLKEARRTGDRNGRNESGARMSSAIIVAVLAIAVLAGAIFVETH
jgi:hypothetical protein